MTQVETDQAKKANFDGGLIVGTACFAAAMIPSYIIGYCYPPFYGFLAGVILGIIAGKYVARLKKRKFISGLICICMVANASLCAGYFSSRISGETIFEHIFGMKPPKSVNAMAGRKQWYDGQIWYVSFQIKQADLTMIINAPELAGMKHEDDGSTVEPKEMPGLWRGTMSTWMAIAHQDQLIEPPIMKRPMIFKLRGIDSMSVESLTIWWDQATDQAYCIKMD